MVRALALNVGRLDDLLSLRRKEDWRLSPRQLGWMKVFSMSVVHVCVGCVCMSCLYTLWVEHVGCVLYTCMLLVICQVCHGHLVCVITFVCCVCGCIYLICIYSCVHRLYEWMWYGVHHCASHVSCVYLSCVCFNSTVRQKLLTTSHILPLIVVKTAF